jgi:hypothetical protein
MPNCGRNYGRDRGRDDDRNGVRYCGEKRGTHAVRP